MNKILKYIIFISLILLFLTITLKGHIIHEDFDSQKWKNWQQTENEWSLRWDMMNSLRKNYELLGMTEYQIINLLGQPSSKQKNELRYNLGYTKKGINTATLIIKLDSNGKVIKYFVLEG